MPPDYCYFASKTPDLEFPVIPGITPACKKSWPANGITAAGQINVCILFMIFSSIFYFPDLPYLAVLSSLITPDQFMP